MRTEKGPRNRTNEGHYRNQRKTATRLLYVTGALTLIFAYDNYLNHHSLMNSDLETKLTNGLGGLSFALFTRRQYLTSKIQYIQDNANRVPWYLRRKTWVPDDDWNPFL